MSCKTRSNMDIHNLVASIKREVEGGHQEPPPPREGRPRRRRDQGHLSSPSTVGDCTPPPPSPSQGPSPPSHPPCARPVAAAQPSLGALTREGATRRGGETGATVGDCSPPPSIPSHGPPPPSILPRGPPTITTRSTPGQSHIPVLHAPRVIPNPPSGSMRGGWSAGPYNWYGPGWLARYPPHAGMDRGGGDWAHHWVPGRNGGRDPGVKEVREAPGPLGEMETTPGKKWAGANSLAIKGHAQGTRVASQMVDQGSLVVGMGDL